MARPVRAIDVASVRHVSHAMQEGHRSAEVLRSVGRHPVDGVQRRFAGAQGQYAHAAAGDRHGVLELRRQLAVAGVHRPFVRLLADGRLALVEHRFDGEHHAFFQCHAGVRMTVVQDLRFLVHFLADAVAAVFLHHAVAMAARVAGNGVADVAQARAGAHRGDAFPHRLVVLESAM
ncbi:hypothetical protein G6F22_016237 [Rhizopus arrhizus]|nr:hypothetical protein G6F22_016237 [Rhizopus arrhizus]